MECTKSVARLFAKSSQSYADTQVAQKMNVYIYRATPIVRSLSYLELLRWMSEERH